MGKKKEPDFSVPWNVPVLDPVVGDTFNLIPEEETAHIVVLPEDHVIVVK